MRGKRTPSVSKVQPSLFDNVGDFFDDLGPDEVRESEFFEDLRKLWPPTWYSEYDFDEPFTLEEYEDQLPWYMANYRADKYDHNDRNLARYQRLKSEMDPTHEFFLTYVGFAQARAHFFYTLEWALNFARTSLAYEGAVGLIRAYSLRREVLTEHKLGPMPKRVRVKCEFCGKGTFGNNHWYSRTMPYSYRLICGNTPKMDQFHPAFIAAVESYGTTFKEWARCPDGAIRRIWK